MEEITEEIKMNNEHEDLLKGRTVSKTNSRVLHVERHKLDVYKVHHVYMITAQLPRV